MSKRKRQAAAEPDAIEAWKAWGDHQYDAGYWASTGRVPAGRHLYFGCMFVLVGSVSLAATAISLLRGMGGSPSGLIFGMLGSAMVLAWGLILLRHSRRRHAGPSRTRRRRHRSY